MFSLKKIASVVMATAMAVTTAVPGTAIVANAETTTIKTRVKNSDKKQNTSKAADMNKLSINTDCLLYTSIKHNLLEYTKKISRVDRR